MKLLDSLRDLKELADKMAAMSASSAKAALMSLGQDMLAEAAYETFAKKDAKTFSSLPAKYMVGGAMMVLSYLLEDKPEGLRKRKNKAMRKIEKRSRLRQHYAKKELRKAKLCLAPMASVQPTPQPILPGEA